MSKNLILPGNPRYQPKDLKDILGYDNLYAVLVEVELATLDTLYEFGVIPDNEYNELSKQIRKDLLNITTTEVDRVERQETKHDIRALVKVIQGIIRSKINRWVHVPLTSYDVIDTGRSLMYLRAYDQALLPKLKQVIKLFADKTKQYSDLQQIGRTHGQHALPITVGFWLATILDRLLYNFQQMTHFACQLRGKISGAVGAYNAQVGLGIAKSDLSDFEETVLNKLGLTPAKISTQILSPEPLAYFLHSCTLCSATLGQFGRDARQLMRTEIAEIREAFVAGQVGSSTMAHKRNPINFENLEGMWLRTKNEYGKVLDTLISEHQRDLVGSCVSRDFPIILVNLQQQLNTLCRKDVQGQTFLERIEVDKASCQKNLQQSAGLVIAEPLYIALQMAGYPKDAHALVNKVLMPKAKQVGSLLQALFNQVESDPQLAEVVERIPSEVMRLLEHPENYTGQAAKKAEEIVFNANKVLNRL